MRYLVQTIVMGSDLVLIGCTFWLIYAEGANTFTLVIAALAFYSWNKSGGFMSWLPATIRAFLKNARGI